MMKSSRWIRFRTTDKPWQWAVLFALFAIVTVPFYCITRRTWKPLLHVSGSLGSAILLWAIVLGLIDGLLGTNYLESPMAENLLYVGCGAAIYGGGYYSVYGLRKDAKDALRDAINLGTGEVSAFHTVNDKQVGNGNFVPAGQIRVPFSRRIALGLSVIVLLLLGGYAIHTTTVEATIKANPVLAAVAKTGTEVKIKHFDCGDMYGYYDASIDTLQICTSVHDDQLISSKESTIRHEAWHLVQACSAVKSKDDEWGRFVTVDSPLLAGKTLTDEEKRYISDNYEPQDHAIESEALLAETHLTDGQIIKEIEGKCYFQ